MFQKEYWERKGLTRRRSPKHPAVAAYVIPKIGMISRYVDITGQTSLLDAGCGNGFFTYYFDKICNVCGIDYSEKMLQANPVKNIMRMDVNDMKFKDGSFDIVFCHGLLHHVENADKVLREMRRVSRKYVIMLEPNRNNPLMFLFALAVRQERRVLRFSLSYLRRMAIKSNLDIIASFPYGMIVPNKTPRFILPLLNLFNFKQPFGMTNFVIAKKT